MATAAILAAPAGCGQRTAAVKTGGGSSSAAADMRGVMERKLVHAQSILEGMTRSRFEQIADDATQLYLISQESSWFVHDTITYTVFSEQFRETARSMAAHAGQKDLEAVTTDYVDMIHTCIACHTYLRKERLTRDFPEKVSSVTP